MSTLQKRNRFSQASEPQRAETPEESVKKASILAEANVPYMVGAIRAAGIFMEPGLRTVAAVDKHWRTYWNPTGVEWMLRAAESVTPKNPCHCGATRHNKYAYLAGVIVHEVGHVAFDHFVRMDEGGYQQRKWNIATDLEMNDDIPEIGKLAEADAKAKGRKPVPAICLPKFIDVDPVHYQLWAALGEPALQKLVGISMWELFQPAGTGGRGTIKVPMLQFPDVMSAGDMADPTQTVDLGNGKIAENYYELIPQPKKQEEGGEGEGQDGEGQDGQQGQGGKKGSKGKEKGEQGDSDGEGQDGEGQEGQGGKGSQAGKGDGKQGNGEPQTKGLDEFNDHGSGSGGEQRPHEFGEPDEKGGAPGISKAEAAAIRRETAAAIKKHQEGQGNVPQGWSVWADTQLKAPKVRWQDKLRKAVRQSCAAIRGEMIPTYRRASRYSVVRNFSVIKPATRDPLVEVIVVVDTSGSMGCGKGSRLERALSECEAILKAPGVHGRFLDCDANVYGKAQEVNSLKQAKIHGGGGTDMDRGVRAAVASQPKPTLIILLTDGETPWPSKKDLKGTRIITAITSESESALSQAPKYMNPLWVDTND